MKIDYLSASRIPSMSANSVHVLKMSAALARAGHDVVLHALRGDESPTTFAEAYRVPPSLRLEFYEAPTGARRRLAAFQAAWTASRRADLVYGRNLPSAVLAASLGQTVVFEAHAPLERLGAKFAFRMLQRGRLALVVVISEALKRRFLEDFPSLSPSSIFVAPDAADAAVFDEGPDVNSRDGEFRVVYTGSLFPGKGMEIIHQLAGLCPWARFVVVGGQDRDVQFWRSKGGAPNIEYVGWVPHRDVGAYIRSASVVLLPNQRRVRAEQGADIGRWTSPMKMFEYMAEGRAIVASDIPVLREVLEHEETALLCSPEDVDAWAAALRALRDDGALRQRIASTAKATFLQRYTWDRRVELVLEAVRNSQVGRDYGKARS